MESSALSASFNADSRPEPAPKPKPKRRRNQPPSLVEKALKPLLFDPKLGLSVDNHERIRAVADPHTDLLADLLEIIKNNPDITTGAIVERYRDTAHQQFLAEQLETPLILEREAYSVEFEQAISGLLKKAEPKAYERAQAEMRRRAEEQAK
jgi:DNA primase